MIIPLLVAIDFLRLSLFLSNDSDRMQLLKRLPVILYWKALVRLIDRKSWIACGKAFHRSSRATNSFNGRLIRHRSGAGGFSLFFFFLFWCGVGKHPSTTLLPLVFALHPPESAAGHREQMPLEIHRRVSLVVRVDRCLCPSGWPAWNGKSGLFLSLSCPRESVTDEGAVGFWRNKKKNPPNVQLHTQLSVFVRVCEPSL